MNHSLRTADPTTHLKIVCLSLVISIIVVVAAVAAPGSWLSVHATWSMQ